MFRLTIRDLLWLTVVVAMATGWWIDRNRLQEVNNKDRAALEKRIEFLAQVIAAEEFRYPSEIYVPAGSLEWKEASGRRIKEKLVIPLRASPE